MDAYDFEDLTPVESTGAAGLNRYDPPAGLSYSDQLMWFDKKVKKLKNMMPICTARYIETDLSVKIQELKVAKEKTIKDHKVPPKNSDKPKKVFKV